MGESLYYKGKIKRGREVADFFETLQKGIKKPFKKKWVITEDVEHKSFIIDFNTDECGIFELKLTDKNEFEGFCYMDIGDETEDGTGLGENIKALLDMFYKAKSYYNSFSVSDDYEICANYLENKKYRCTYRELNQIEKERVLRLFEAGNQTHREFLIALMSEDMNMDKNKFLEYIIDDTKFYDGFSVNKYEKEMIGVLNFLWETTTFKKDGIILCNYPEEFFYDINALFFAVYPFAEIMKVLLKYDESQGKMEIRNRHACPQDKQMDLLFCDFFLPAFLNCDNALSKCMETYRFFLSAGEFLKLNFK